jgi:iron complex outermembrane receptor protein
MFMNNKMANSVRIALAFGAVSTAAFTANSAVAAEEDAVKKVERIEVTGSRIKRTDMETASPVEVISAGDLKDQGRLSVADALRNLTANTFGSLSPASGSGAQSQSSVSLLGAGSERSLVLLDGKRIAGSPSLGGASANLSSIPMAAVERIEVLKDGASAIYGSDAVAGVVNIILKDDFEGVAFDATVGRPSKEGGDTKTMSFAAGTSTDKMKITFVYDHQEQGEIYDRDRDYTKANMEDKNGDGMISIYDETTGVSYYGATIINPETDNYIASPKCNDLTKTVPGFVGVLDQGSALGVVGEGTVCGYAFANVSANKASTNRDAVMTNVGYQITDDIELYTRALFSKNESFGRYAPPAADWENISVGNEHNAFDVPVTGHFRWYGIGPRDNYIEDFQQDYMVGLKGTAMDSMDWEVYYHRATLDYHNAGRNYLSYGGLAYNLAEGIELGSDEGQKNMALTTYRKNVTKFDHYFAGTTMEFGELPAGAISHYVGAEMFEQVFSSRFDAQSEAGLVGGSAGASAAGDRDVKAVFYEVSAPILDILTVSAAIRRDDYSDAGASTTPSVKVEFRPIDDLMLRASVSEGFRVASLEDLLGADAFSATSAKDYKLCKQNNVTIANCRARQFNNQVLSNKDLKPETSRYINAGLVYSGIEDVTFKIDFFSLEVDDVIDSITVQDILSADYGGVSAALLAKYPKLQFKRNANGAVDGAIYTTMANGGTLTRKGFDFELGYNLDLNDLGRLNFKSVTTFLTESGADVYFGGPKQDFIGSDGAPEWRSQFTTSYVLGDLSVSLTTDAIASTYEDSALIDLGNGNLQNEFSNHVGTYAVHNLNVSYDFGTYGLVTVGARNLFDKGVQKDDAGVWIDDPLYLAGHYGREAFAGYSIKF